MFRAARNKRDANEKDIVDRCKQLGASVTRIKGVFPEDAGCPDLLVGYKGHTLVVEVKDPARDHARSKECIRLDRLDADQVEWFANWKGAVPKVWTSPEQALRDLAAL